MKKNSVAVIGLWHLGCTVAASLAKSGMEVAGFDFDSKLISNLSKAIMPIEEAGLTELTAEQIKKGNLVFTNDFKKLSGYKYIVIGYDTPVGDDDKPDLSVVKKAVGEIKKYAPKGATLIVMSQVPAGTCRGFYNQLKSKKIEVVYNPENLRLSQAIDTYLNADRQIIGLSSEAAKPAMKKFYSFYRNPLMFMSLESAEIVKHSINSFLAMSVSFINQIADLSEAVGGDITDIVKGVKSDSRIGQKAFLSPGLGFAGGTLGRDLRVLEDLGKKLKVKLPLISDVYKINQERKQALFAKIKKQFGKLQGKKFALLGLVYKPGTNTLRRSLSLEVAAWLKSQRVEVYGFDPALKDPKAVEKSLQLQPTAYQAVKGADAVLVITEWPEFKELDYKKIKSTMKGLVIFDTKNILNRKELIKLGYKYYGTGL